MVPLKLQQALLPFTPFKKERKDDSKRVAAPCEKDQANINNSDHCQLLPPSRGKLQDPRPEGLRSAQERGGEGEKSPQSTENVSAQHQLKRPFKLPLTSPPHSLTRFR